MTDRLPTELVLAILQEAAELSISAGDRATVVSMALTAKFVHKLLRPIMFRRVVMTSENTKLVGGLLQSDSVATLIRELCIVHAGWHKGQAGAAKLAQIRCIRGFRHTTESLVKGLPESGRASLSKVQVWNDQVFPVPPSVTHVCLLFDGICAPSPIIVAAWISTVPSLTHVGCEFVARREMSSWDTTAEPEKIAAGMRDAIAAGGQQLVELAVRLCGNVSDDHWESLLVALRTISIANQDMHLGRRLRIWRDERVLYDLDEDLKISADDALAGVDVWSEARTFDELYNMRRMGA